MKSATLRRSVVGKRWQHALGVPSKIRRSSLGPTLMSFNATIPSCEASGQWESVVQLVQPGADFGTYAAVLRSCGVGGRRGGASGVFLSMRLVSLKPDIVSCILAIGACEGGEEYLCSLGILAETWRCARGEQWENALDVFSNLRPGCVQLNVIGYIAAIIACANGEQWQKAVRTLMETRPLQWQADVTR